MKLNEELKKVNKKRRYYERYNKKNGVEFQKQKSNNIQKHL